MCPKPKLCCLSQVGQWWGGSASLNPAIPTTEQHSQARPSSSSSTEETPSLNILHPATHTFLLPGTPLQNITSNDIPLLQKGYKSFLQVRQWLPQAFSRALCGQTVFCWQPQGLSPLCWEEDGGRSQKPAQVLACSWQLTFFPRPTHTWVYSICCLWLFWPFFSPRLPLCHLHKVIHEYVIPQNLDGENHKAEKKTPTILNSVEKQVIDSAFK